MRVAVIGGGIFGCTAAIEAARAGHEVHLYERGNALLQAASGINQFRLHAGFHYPRSPETVRECQEGLASFKKAYPRAIIERGRQFYAIAREGSKTSASAFLNFCAAHGLPYGRGGEFVNWSAISEVVSVNEARVDVQRLRASVMRKLRGVHLHLGRPASIDLRDEFDQIVIATYAATNEVAQALAAPVAPFQYEVVEKPVLRLPRAFADVSIVVMDGEFCSVDPFGNTGLHVMGHVKHAIHSSNTGLKPEVPGHLARYLNRCVIVEPEHSRFRRFIESGRRFIPILAEAEHQGSMFTVRAVLPNRDHDDARPTVVERLDDQVIRVFAGKLGCSVNAARSVVTSLDRTGAPALSAA